jgi:DNA uptake protein ComE-like DNA-binding protein
VSLNSATFEQLRSLGMSVTQTGRVLAYRERNQSFRSVEELDAIPGFPNGFLDGIRDRLSV